MAYCSKKNKQTISVCKSKNIAKKFLEQHFDNSNNCYAIECFCLVEN